MDIYIKNNDTELHTWSGQEILAGEYYLIEDNELSKWKSNSQLLIDIANAIAIVARDNTGSNDIINISDAINYLKEIGPIEVTPVQSQITTDGKIQKVSMYKAEGSSATRVSHDFTDPCTWYQKSTLVSNKTLTFISGTTYSCGDINLIDLVHGRLYGEDEVTNNSQHYKINLAYGLPNGRIYQVKVWDNGVLLTEDVNYTINYEQGTFDFSNYTANNPLTATYYKATTPTFILTPTPGKLMMIEHAEIQLSVDCNFVTPINFEVWIYHPNQNAYPGVKILYQMITYKNIKDIISSCNLGTGVIKAISGLTNDVSVLPFLYATSKPFRSSLGAELRITIDGDQAMTGEWGTATFYILSQAE